MGLTSASTGLRAVDMGFSVKKISEQDRVIALAGNPNVGKSTVFNALTGLRQHTGNWPGKTVSNAQGVCRHSGENYIMVDIPGTYSLMAHSKEEEVARDFICFGNPDGVIVVCDATCLERNLNMVLQTLEITKNVVVCVNLMDEAKKKEIKIDLKGLSKKLGVPVVGTSAQSGRGLNQLMHSMEQLLKGNSSHTSVTVHYIKPIEEAVEKILPLLGEKIPECRINRRWIALRLLDEDKALYENLEQYLHFDLLGDAEVSEAVRQARALLLEAGYDSQRLQDAIVSCMVLTAEDLCNGTVTFENQSYQSRDRRIDRVLTHRVTGIPIMLLLLGVIFWITISGANYPSKLLSDGLFWIQDWLIARCVQAGIPEWLYELLVLGIYRVTAWVISVMLPPMAIFFPLFTLLEDLGYLPRVAFNLDKVFQKCSACGKQALTMCMGFGCNAAGIVGCRIIDSPRERLIAILTNSFVPCNGRFPTMIAVITMFFTFSAVSPFQSVFGALCLTGAVLFGILMTFLISRVLSKTILKGETSSFTLELPPYRKPRIGRILVRSVLDRTLFVLGRAVAAAAPAGLIIWCFANVEIQNVTLLSYCSSFLDPFAKILGLDGVILLAFILGLPANEIVMPIIIMAYMATGTLTDMENMLELRSLLTANGWTWVTAVSTLLFSLMHWPCATTLLTIKRETGGIKWTALAVLVPAATGMIVCTLFTTIVKLFGCV